MIALTLLTYFSIDSVNTKSTLEGNVLENEAYTISMVNRLKQYGEYENDADIIKSVFTEQHHIMKNKQTNKQKNSPKSTELIRKLASGDNSKSVIL